MAIKKLMLAGAIAASLAGAATVGALVGSPSVSYAEEATDETTTDDGSATDETSTDETTTDDSGRPPGPGGGGPASLDIAAEALGITEDELRTELEGGASITSVAEAQGVDVQTVIDALVADATTRIQERVDADDLDAAEAEERIAALPDRMAEFVAVEGLPARGPGGGDC